MKTLLCALAAIAFLSPVYVLGDEPVVKDFGAQTAIADFKKQRATLDEAFKKLIADYQIKYPEKLTEFQRTLISNNGRYNVCEFRDPNTLSHPPFGDLKRVIELGR